MPFTFQPLELPGLVLVTPKVFADDRGLFLETYQRAEFAGHGIPTGFVQDNISTSRRGVVRGLHYQLAPVAQAKLVSTVAGEIYDVVVDIRRGSPAYGRWVGVTLSSATRQILFVPVGFAHGFAVLSEEATVLYKTSASYSPAHDRGVRWDDPALGITWPVSAPLLSPKDRQLPPLAQAENNFTWENAQ